MGQIDQIHKKIGNAKKKQKGTEIKGNKKSQAKRIACSALPGLEPTSTNLKLHTSY